MKIQYIIININCTNVINGIRNILTIKYLHYKENYNEYIICFFSFLFEKCSSIKFKK